MKVVSEDFPYQSSFWAKEMSFIADKVSEDHSKCARVYLAAFVK